MRLQSPLDLSPVVANSHVPEHDAPIPSSSGKKVALPPSCLGRLRSLHQSSSDETGHKHSVAASCTQDRYVTW